MKLRTILIFLGAITAGTTVLVKRVAPAGIAFNSIDPEQAVDDDSTFIDVMGLHVRTRIGGQGQPAIILLHGFAASVFTWHKVFEPLSEIGTVIAFDRPASGLTSRPILDHWEGHNPYSLESQAELTIGMLDHLGIDRAVVIGHSAGGTVAALTALNYPERVESLILMSPAIYTDVPPPPWLCFLIDAAPMRRIGPWIARSLVRLTNPIMDRAWHDPSHITPEIRRGYIRSFEVKQWDEGMWEAARANRPTGLRHQIDALKVRTLVLTGDDDRVVPVQQTERLARELPNAVLKVIPACGHIPQEEQSERFLEIVAEFIRSSTDFPE